jgi:hypothetical protein
LAQKSEGLYVNILEKALKKKKREESSSSCASKASTAKSKMEQEVGSGSAPPFMGIDQLIHLGKDYGFDDTDEGQLLDAANSMTNGV